MMQVKPGFTIQGTYRFRAVNAYDAPACFYQGRCVYRFDGRQMERIGILNDKAAPESATVSFHPTRPAATFRDTEGSLLLGDFEGNLLWRGAAHCESALISNDGAWVWAVSRIDENTLQILLYTCRDGAVISALAFPDTLYRSHVMLTDIPRSGAVTMQLAAGQDGIAVHQLEYAGDMIHTRELFPNTCYTAPAWKPDGTRFLTLENDEYTMACYSYPQMEKLGEEVPVEFASEEAWGYANGHYQVYLDDGRAIIQTINNRYFLFSPQRLERTGELTIAGYEPRPTNEVFPNLRDDTTPTCEIECLERLGRYIVAYTWRRGKETLQDMLIFREDELTAATSLDESENR